MSKKMQNSTVKTSRKAIQQSLIAEFNKITGKFGPASEKLLKEVKKGSKKLAKIISKELKPAQSAIQETGNEVKNAVAPAPKVKSKKAATPAKTEAAPEPPAKAAVVKPAPSKKKQVAKASAETPIKKDNQVS
jgi:hypothetical protein